MAGAVKAITIVDGLVTAASGGLIGTADLVPTAVTPASYTLASITVDASGRVTAASSGTGGGGGTVTAVAVASANGFTGTSDANPTTPTLTLTTSVTGLLKGNGTAVSAAVAGTDYLTPAGAAALYQPLDGDLTALAALTGTSTVYYRSGASTWSPVTIGAGLTFTGGTLAATNTGTVTSVSVGDLSPLFTSTVGTSTTTPAVTFALSTHAANTVFAGPTSGSAAAPTFRALVALDVPDLSATYSTVAHTHAFAALTSKPTTLTGYGITDGQPLDGTLTALAALTIAANSLTVGTGADAFAQTTFAASTFPARSSAGSLVAKPITDYALTLVDDVDATAARSTLGLGTLATQSGTFSGTSSGTNTGDQTITLTGNVTGSGTGSFATTIAAAAVTNAMLAGSISLTTKVTGILPSANGGTGNGFTKFTGPASTEKLFALPNTNDTLVGYGTAGTFTAAQTFNNAAGVKILDTDQSHTLGVTLGNNLTADRVLTLSPGDANRILTLTADATVGGTSSGTNTGDQTITLTGDVTGSGIGSFAATVVAASDTAAGKIEIATAAEQETGTDTVRAVTPGRQHHHTSAAKGWVKFTLSGTTVTVVASYNVSSVTRNALGVYTINWATAFSSANYAVALSAHGASGIVTAGLSAGGMAAGSVQIITFRTATEALQEAATACVAAFGDQ